MALYTVLQPVVVNNPTLEVYIILFRHHAITNVNSCIKSELYKLQSDLFGY